MPFQIKRVPRLIHCPPVLTARLTPTMSSVIPWTELLAVSYDIAGYLLPSS